MYSSSKKSRGERNCTGTGTGTHPRPQARQEIYRWDSRAGTHFSPLRTLFRCELSCEVDFSMVFLNHWGGLLVPLPNLEPAVVAALAKPSSCVPESTIMLTLFNDHHRSLYNLQFSRVRNLACLIQRLVTVCYGSAACHEALGMAVVGGAVRPSDFRKGAYVELTWAKWRLLHAALQVARVVMFVDSDVVLFRNPFAALDTAADAHDIRFLAELACEASSTCASQPAWRKPMRLPGSAPWPCSLNGGILLLTSRTLAARVVAREPIFEYGHKNASGMPIDQDAADEIANHQSATGVREFSSCALPSSSFVGFCWWAWGYNKGNRSLFDNLRPCKLAAFHAHCMVSVSQKVAAIERMLSKTAQCPGGDPTSAETTGERLGKWGPRAPPGDKPGVPAKRKHRREKAPGRPRLTSDISERPP